MEVFKKMAENRHQKTKYVGVTFQNKNEDKVFYIRYRRGGRDTKEFFESVGKSSQGMTAAKANHIRSERMSGKELSNSERRQALIEKKKQEQGQYSLERIWNVYYEENKHKVSIKSDKACLVYLDSILDKPVYEITKSDIDSIARNLKIFVSPRTKKVLSAQTQKHVLALVKRLFGYARDKDLCEVPSFKINMPKVDNEKTEFMTQAQTEAYLKALDEDPNVKTANILKFIFYTGIRKGATLALKWEDVNLEQGYIKLKAENAKNNKTEILPLSDKAISILEDTEKMEDSPYVFPNSLGFKRDDIRKFADKIKKKAGLDKDFRPVHGLRHNFASSLVNNGADLYSVQKLLTHSSPEMTQRYAHLQMDTLKELLNKNDKDKD